MFISHQLLSNGTSTLNVLLSTQLFWLKIRSDLWIVILFLIISYQFTGFSKSQWFLPFARSSRKHSVLHTIFRRLTHIKLYLKMMHKKHIFPNTLKIHSTRLQGEHKDLFSDTLIDFIPCRVRNVLARFSWLQHGETPVQNRIADSVPRKEIYKLLTHAGLVAREDFPYA